MTASIAGKSDARYYADTRNELGSSDLFHDDDSDDIQAVDHQDLFSNIANNGTPSGSQYLEDLSDITNDSNVDDYQWVFDVTR